MVERAEAEASKSAEGEQKFVNMMLDAARQIDQKKEEIDELLQATCLTSHSNLEPTDRQAGRQGRAQARQAGRETRRLSRGRP